MALRVCGSVIPDATWVWFASRRVVALSEGCVAGLWWDLTLKLGSFFFARRRTLAERFGGQRVEIWYTDKAWDGESGDGSAVPAWPLFSCRLLGSHIG